MAMELGKQVMAGTEGEWMRPGVEQDQSCPTAFSQGLAWTSESPVSDQPGDGLCL